MSWDDDYFSKELEPPKIPKDDVIDWNQKYCFHEWKSTLLIISTVYDCKKCGVKKEVFDKWKNQG